MSRARRRRAAKARGREALWNEPWFLVALATLLAAALRFHDIGRWSFWIDEAHTFRDATLPLDGENGFWSQDRAYYPLSFLGLRFLLDLGLGQTEGWLRLPFAAVGVLTVPLMWRCGRRIIGEGAAVFSAFLLALMPWHLFWSQNARGYVFVVLASVLATGWFWKWADERRGRDLIRAFLALLVGASFHPTAAFQALGILGFLVLQRLGRDTVRGLLLGTASLLLLAVVLPWAVREFSPIKGFLSTKTDVSVVHLAFTTGFYFRPLLLVSAAAGFLLLRRRLGRDRALFLFALVAVPLVVLTVLGSTLAKTTARYAICALPPLLWLGAAASREMVALLWPERRPALRLCGLFLGLALLADFAAGTWGYYAQRHGDRARWREACCWVRDRFGERPLRVLTVNAPSVLFYLAPEVWRNAGLAEGPYDVRALTEWSNKGRKKGEPVRHAPGWGEHLRWQQAEAAKDGEALVVLLKRPELDEIDRGRSLDPETGEPIDRPGALWSLLRREFEIALYLPCWVGPKDEGVWVFLPNGS